MLVLPRSDLGYSVKTMRKYMTRDQAEASKEKAARFVETALHDPEHADAIRAESLDDWIARKRIPIRGEKPTLLRLSSR